MGSSNLLDLYQSKGRKKAKPVEPIQQDYILSVESGPYLNLYQRRRSHVSISSEHLLVGPNKAKLTSSQGTDAILRRKSESSLMDLTNSVEALTRCIETINMQKAVNRKIEKENQERKIEMEERQRLSECSKIEASETTKIGDFGRNPRNFLPVQQVTTPAMLKLNQQGSATASCRSSISNKSENSKNNNRNMSNSNGDGDYIQPNFGNVRTSSVPRSRPSQLGILVNKEENGKQRSPPPIDSVTMIYRKSNEKPSIASIQVQHLDAVELDSPDAVAQLIKSKVAPPKPPGLGLRTAIKIESEQVEGRQHGNLPGRSGTHQSHDSESAPTSLNTGMGGRHNFDKRQPWSNAAPDETETPARKLKIRGLRNFVEKRRPGPHLWARQFPCRSKFHADSYLYEFEGPTAPKRPVEAMSACRKKCGRCRACGVFSDNVCPQCGNCPFDCKCQKNGFSTEEDQPGPEYFLSQILGSNWSQKQKIQVNNNNNNSDDEPQPIYPRSRNLNNLTSSNNPLKISNPADSPVKPMNGDPPAPPVIATGYNTYAPASPGMVPPGGPPFYPGYGYPYFTPGPPAPVMPMMYPPGMVPVAAPMAPPPFYAPYPPGYPSAPGGIPPPYAPGPVY